MNHLTKFTFIETVILFKEFCLLDSIFEVFVKSCWFVLHCLFIQASQARTVAHTGCHAGRAQEANERTAGKKSLPPIR